MEEPIDASDEVVYSSEKDGRRDDSSKCSWSLPSTAYDFPFDKDTAFYSSRSELSGREHGGGKAPP